MFNYNNIELLLSKTAKQVLSDSDNFTQISNAVSELIYSITLLTSADVINNVWLKTPFVMLTEYFVINRLDSVNADLHTKAESYYANAMQLLNNKKSNTVASKLGSIEGLYDAEF